MRVLTARNVHQALPLGLRLLAQEGERRESRNGPVLVAPFPVTTVYERPCERVLFWPERDANPFFHLYESLWMLAGRRDVAGVVKYAKNMANYSDNGATFHGAYGYRWRHYGENPAEPTFFGYDQLPIIIETLRKNPEDRRCVLQMWGVRDDLGQLGKDFPCNLTATFQRDSEGKLDLTVFCRSNDIVWGAYGANAVHFSFLLEYMALAIGCPVGVYRQVSVNWHGYLKTLEQVKGLWENWIDHAGFIADPYSNGSVHTRPMCFNGHKEGIKGVDAFITKLLLLADEGSLHLFSVSAMIDNAWEFNVYTVLAAHEAFRNREDPDRFLRAEAILLEGDQKCDWVVAAYQWLRRRAIRAGVELS